MLIDDIKLRETTAKTRDERIWIKSRLFQRSQDVHASILLRPGLRRRRPRINTGPIEHHELVILSSEKAVIDLFKTIWDRSLATEFNKTTRGLLCYVDSFRCSLSNETIFVKATKFLIGPRHFFAGPCASPQGFGWISRKPLSNCVSLFQLQKG